MTVDENDDIKDLKSTSALDDASVMTLIQSQSKEGSLSEQIESAIGFFDEGDMLSGLGLMKSIGSVTSSFADTERTVQESFDSINDLSMTMGLLQNYLQQNPDWIASMPKANHDNLLSVASALENAQNSVKEITQLAQRYGMVTSDNHKSEASSTIVNDRPKTSITNPRMLSSPNSSLKESKKFDRVKFTSISAGEHRMRAEGKSRRLFQGLGDRDFLSSSRYQTSTSGSARRKLMMEEGGTSCRVDDTENDLLNLKRERCGRLVDCAEKYSYYDLLVFLFADDIDFEFGDLADENIKVVDERNIVTKHKRIQNLVDKFRATVSFLNGSSSMLITNNKTLHLTSMSPC